MRKRWMSLALALGLLAGCGGEGAAESPPAAVPTPTAQVEQVRAAEFALPRTEESMHPILSRDRVNLSLAGLVWEGLYALDQSFEPQPVLCQSASVSEDALTWTFTLKPGVTFSDGSPLTAQEAADSLNLARGESSRFAGRLSGVRSVKAVDGAVVVELTRPNGALPALLDVPIVKGEREEPLGTGPYVLEGWGEDCRLTARADWWSAKGAAAPAETIPLRTLKEADDLIYAFDTGEIALVTADLTGTSALGFAGDHEVWDCPGTTLVFVGYNCAKGPCAEAAVRQAVSRGLDRATVAAALYARHAVASALPVHPDSALWDQATADSLEYAPQTMGELLTAAGWEKGEEGRLVQGRKELSLKLVVNTDNSFRVAVADYLAGELDRAGITVDLQKLSWTDYQKALEAGDFDLYLGATAMTADFDPTPLLTGELNYGRYYDAETAGLLSAFQAASGAERKTAAAALYGRLAQEAPFAALCFKNQSVLTQRGAVGGLTPTQQDPFYGVQGWKIG